MRRRGFLGLLGRGAGAVGVAAVAPTATAKILATAPAASSTGFGLAAVKREGGRVLYDANFAKALYPGVKKWWSKHYDDMPQYTELF